MAIDLLEMFAAWRARHTRRAWKPVCTRAPGGQFGGAPLLGPGEAWPTCEQCDRPLQFFLQIDVATLPAAFGARGAGTLQLFCCTWDGDCETHLPFSGTHVVRLLTGPAGPARHPGGLAPFPARTIQRWDEIIDLPHPEEHGALGLSYDHDFAAWRTTVRGDGLVVADIPIDREGIAPGAAETIADAAPGDKLGGWPRWVQRVEYPTCPTCGQRMELVLQLGSEDNVPYMFGDVGTGHITQCPTHPEVLAFGWASS